MADDGSTFSGDERGAAQARAFDQIGHHYDEVFPHKEGQIQAGRWMLEQTPPGARMLDVGCGTGLPTALQLAEAGVEVVGVDISPVMLDLARTNVADGRFHQLDVLDDRVRDLGPFDAVAAFFSLLMLPRAQIPMALARIHESLVPDGVLGLAMVEADLDDVPIPFLGSTVRVSGYPREELRAVVEAAGYRVEEEAVRSYAPPAEGAPPEVQVFLHCRRVG